MSAALDRFLRHRATLAALQVATGLLFLAAALPKIADPAAFAAQVHHYRLVPFGLENLLAITVPWIELTAALAILTRVHPRAGSWVAASLLAVFTAAVAAAAARHLDIRCGCFGTADAARVGTAKLIENLGLLAIAALAGRRPC